MKKLFVLLSVLFFALMLPVVAVCNDGGEVGLDLSAYFVSLSGLAGAALAVTEFIKKIIGSSGAWTKYVSWVVSIGLAFVGWWLNIGMLAGISELWVVVYGVCAGLVANSIFDLKLIKGFLVLLGARSREE